MRNGETHTHTKSDAEVISEEIMAENVKNEWKV